MQTGTTLGHYRITAKLGEGGMGQVFRAEDLRLKRDVAIKVLPAEVAGDSERIARMEREAQVLASLEHPNIASIYGIEEATVDGLPIRFLAMQLAEGRTLADRIAEGPVPLSESLQIALQIAEGLEAAHEKGVIHRDLKPANIQLGTDGTVKLLDFGLAKAIEGKGGKSSTDLTASPTVLEATRQGVILGTAAYMSPEQARGQRVDRRTDIWAYGAVLFEMLSGTQVFGGPTATDVLGGIVHKEPDWKLLPEGTPRRIQVLLKRCLRKDPKRRLQAVGDARVTIVDYLEDPVAAEGLVGAAPAPGWQRLLPWGVAAAGLALAAAIWVLRAPAEPNIAPPVRAEIPMGVGPLYGGSGSGVALSADGHTLVAVSSQSTGTSQSLWLREIDGATNVNLVQTDADGPPYSPFFSPDGQWLGFARPGGLYKVPTSGGTPQKLADLSLSRGSSWGDDGRIVFSPSPGSALMVISENGGEATPVTTLDAARGEITHRWPQLLPDGRGVIFTAHTTTSDFDRAYIDVLDLRSGERKTLVRGGFAGRWVPSGHLLYANGSTLFAMPFDMDRLEVTGSAVPVIEKIRTSTEAAADWTLSDQGTLVYRTGTVRLPTHRIAWLSEGRLTPLWEQEQTYAEPRLSPDGTKLAVMIFDTDNWDLWTYDIARGVATRLTFDTSMQGPGIWSPDGREIIYSSAENGAADLYRRRADGSGDVTRLTNDPESTFFVSDWSDDGRYVLFSSDQTGAAGIMFLDLQEGGEPQEFLPAVASAAEGQFSPDGKWVVYQSDESGRGEVYVRPFPPAGGKWQISDNGGGYPYWSGDGRALYYRTNEGISVVDVRVDDDSLVVGRSREAATGSFRGGTGGMPVGSLVMAHYAVAKDGRLLVFPQVDEGEDYDALFLRVVTNFFDVLRRRVPTGN